MNNNINETNNLPSVREIVQELTPMEEIPQNIAVQIGEHQQIEHLHASQQNQGHTIIQEQPPILVSAQIERPHMLYQRNPCIYEETELRLREVLGAFYTNSNLTLVLNRLVTNLPDNFDVCYRFSDLKMKMPEQLRVPFNSAFDSLVSEGLILKLQNPSHKARIYIKRSFDIIH